MWDRFNRRLFPEQFAIGATETEGLKCKFPRSRTGNFNGSDNKDTIIPNHRRTGATPWDRDLPGDILRFRKGCRGSGFDRDTIPLVPSPMAPIFSNDLPMQGQHEAHSQNGSD
jgi:hypothetical protein